MATKLPINTDTLLILEKAFETGDGNQHGIENLNVIEQLLVGIIEQLNENYPELKASFIVRRLPAFTIPYFTKNEYAVILENLDFTLSTPNQSVSDSASIDGKPIKISLGHTEIYKREAEIPANSNAESKNEEPNGQDGKTYGSHEIFQRFSSAFVKGFSSEVERDMQKAERNDSEKVQLIGAHLLHSVKFNTDVQKIFKLSQAEVWKWISSKKKSRCKLQVNQDNCTLLIELDGTEVIVRPGLFLKNGYSKIHADLLERIPLYHPSILTIGESLLKGCFLMPTSYESLWTIQFWPSESHIIFGFHPSSIIGRIFRLYGSFCLNPINFWEQLNSCFLIGVEDMQALCQDAQSLSIDFVMSTFLEELEHLPEVTDWEPKNFSIRFTVLLSRAVDAYEKKFEPDYYTKRNILKYLWKKSETFPGELDEPNGLELHHVDSMRSTSVPPENSNRENSNLESKNFNEDEFGLQLDELSLEERDGSQRFQSPRRKSTVDSTMDSNQELDSEPKKQSRSLSKYIGTTLLRRLSMGTSGFNERRPESLGRSTLQGKTNRSMTDIAAGFEGIVNQQRRDHIRQRAQVDERESLDDVFSSSLAFAETSFSVNPANPAGTDRGIVNEACESKDSIYTAIFQILNEISPSNYLSNTELITHLDNCRKVMMSQGELITSWTQIIKEIPRPKHVCPHSFSPRQIQSISLVVQTLSKCTTVGTAPKGLAAWEIIGNILRSALHQMRSEGNLHGRKRESLKEKRKRSGFSFKSLKSSTSFAEGSLAKSNPAKSNPARSTSTVSKLSFRTGSYDICKYHTDLGLDSATETILAMEDPETAATNRLLQWLWQLRNSEIGRLSRRAQKFMESLYNASLIQSHFLEQFAEIKAFESMALRSAVAVSRIMADNKYPTEVPLMTASKRGWQWSDMVLSFAAWNEEKGNVMKAKIPLINSGGYLTREIRMKSAGPTDGQQTLKRIHNPTEPDTEALNLAFHSELATPLGMYDFEEPLCPGPYTVAILIFTSSYFSQWEVVPGRGNIVHALVRLQKFIVLQHIATMLSQPHRKTAINEVRKLSKSLAFSAFQFEDNVMTKTFRRLASMRNTRRFFSSQSCKENTYSCDEVKCHNSTEDDTKVSQHKGKNIECTKL